MWWRLDTYVTYDDTNISWELSRQNYDVMQKSRLLLQAPSEVGTFWKVLLENIMDVPGHFYNEFLK